MQQTKNKIFVKCSIQYITKLLKQFVYTEKKNNTTFNYFPTVDENSDNFDVALKFAHINMTVADTNTCLYADNMADYKDSRDFLCGKFTYNNHRGSYPGI